MIRDQIVEKCHSKKLKERLLQHEILAFNQTIKIAKATENTEQEVQLIAGAGTKENPLVLNHLGTVRNEMEGQLCHRCGNSGHQAQNCRALSLSCRKCGKIRHLARVCRMPDCQKPNKKNLNRRLDSKVQAVSGNWLDEESTSKDDFEPVCRLNTKDGSVQISVRRLK